MGISGVGLLSTIIASPIIFGLKCAALACGLLGVVGKFINRRQTVKKKKHDEIRVLADNKLNTITVHVSTALIDGEISDHKFRLVLSEVSKYHQIKNEIMTRTQEIHAAVILDKETKTPSFNVDETRPGQALQKNVEFTITFACYSTAEEDHPPKVYPIKTINLYAYRKRL